LNRGKCLRRINLAATPITEYAVLDFLLTLKDKYLLSFVTGPIVSIVTELIEVEGPFRLEEDCTKIELIDIHSNKRLSNIQLGRVTDAIEAPGMKVIIRYLDEIQIFDLSKLNKGKEWNSVLTLSTDDIERAFDEKGLLLLEDTTLACLSDTKIHFYDISTGVKSDEALNCFEKVKKMFSLEGGKKLLTLSYFHSFVIVWDWKMRQALYIFDLLNPPLDIIEICPCRVIVIDKKHLVSLCEYNVKGVRDHSVRDVMQLPIEPEGSHFYLGKFLDKGFVFGVTVKNSIVFWTYRFYYGA